MKVRDLIARIIVPVDNDDRYMHHAPTASWRDTCEALDLNHYANFWSEDYDEDSFERRFKHIPIAPWYCTDQWVGLYALALDGEVIALSFQQGRKCDTNYEFVDIEAVKKAQDAIKSMVTKKADESNFAFIDLDQAIPERYKISYVEQLLTDKLFYQGEECERIREIDPDSKWGGPMRYGYDHPFYETVLLKRPNGEEVRVTIDDLDVPYMNVRPE